MTWDTEQWRAERDRRLMEWIGDADAVRMCVQVSHIAEVWDDLHDGDRIPSQREVAHAFESAMIHLQCNPFYMRNHATLMGLIVLMANAWHDSNAWEKSAERWKVDQAFYLRNTGIEIAILAVFLARGYDAMRQVSAEIREFFHHETVQEWKHAA